MAGLGKLARLEVLEFLVMQLCMTARCKKGGLFLCKRKGIRDTFNPKFLALAGNSSNQYLNSLVTKGFQ
jgi:hypothetical protein